MAASTLRFAIIVALAVGGILLINRAFPEAQGGGARSDGGVQVTDSPSPSPTATKTPRPTPSPTVAGTSIAVFNGAGVTGLAGDTMARLIEEYGYVEGQPVADAPAAVDVTTLFYRAPADKVEAEHLANEFFGDLADVRVAKLDRGADVEQDVQVAVYLGIDYADLVA